MTQPHDANELLRDRLLRHRRPQVMVVDDDLSMCEFLRTFLSERGYQAITLGNAEEAVKRYHAERPAAVILDVVHAGSDGRPRRAGGVQEDRSRCAGDRALGPGPHHDRRAGDEARRGGLRQQAVRRARARRAAGQRAQAAAAQPRGGVAARGAAVAVALPHARSATASGWPRCAS